MLKLFFCKIFQWLTIRNLVSKTWQVQPISPGCSITHTHRSLVLLQVAKDSLSSPSLFLLVHIAWNVIYPQPHTHTPNCKTPICLQISPNVTSLRNVFPLWFTGWRVKWLNVSVLESMTCYFNHPCIPVSMLLCCPRKCASIEPLLLWISIFFCMLAQSSARTACAQQISSNELKRSKWVTSSYLQLKGENKNKDSTLFIFNWKWDSVKVLKINQYFEWKNRYKTGYPFRIKDCRCLMKEYMTPFFSVLSLMPVPSATKFKINKCKRLEAGEEFFKN